MKSKTLSSANTHLRTAKSGEMVARNIATSTSVETGKPSQMYVTRYREARTGKFIHSNNSKSPRKSSS